MSDMPTDPRINKRTVFRYTIGAAIIVTAITFYIVRSFQGSFQYYVTVSEYHRLTAEDNLRPDQYLRIAGTVVPGSIRTEIDDRSLVSFQIREGGNVLSVTYNGIAPSNFKDDTSVVIEGTYPGKGVTSFKAEKLITKCASKYTEGLRPLNPQK